MKTIVIGDKYEILAFLGISAMVRGRSMHDGHESHVDEREKKN